MSKPGIAPRVEYQGLHDVSDEGPRELIRQAAERALARLGRDYQVDRLELHFKAHEPPGSQRSRFQVTAHLRTDEKAVVGRAEGWNLIEATDTALQALERQAASKHSARQATHNRRPNGPS